MFSTIFDDRQIHGIDIYTINSPGHSEVLNVTSSGSQHECDVRINVTTIGIEKANTIAVYETNGTVFNGHYQEQERMNIIQLYVNDSGVGTPFVEGPNVIVIPTSLFTETIFNAYVQNETLDETPIYSADEEIFKFISVGRDGDTKQACDEIDFVIIRFNISSEDAMEILNLLLECLVNETTNETAIVYSYASTKINGTSAVMMNLPISVLGFIPWFCEKESSLFGKKPKTKKQALWAPLKKLASFAAGLIITIGMAILELIELFIDFVMDILMEWLPILEYILWLIIRAIILIFIWIMFAFDLFFTFIMFLALMVLFLIIGPLLQSTVNITINSITIHKNGKYFTFEYTIGLEYCDFLDIEIPTIYYNFKTENGTYSSPSNFFTFYIIPPLELLINQFASGIFTENNLQENSSFQIVNTDYALHEGLRSSNTASERDEDFWSGFFFGVDVAGFFFAMLGALALGLDDKRQTIAFIIGTILFITTFIFDVISYHLTGNKMSPDYYAGLLFGPWLAFLGTVLIALTINKFVSGKHENLETGLYWGGYIIAFWGLFITIFDFREEIVEGEDLDFTGGAEFWIELGLGFIGITMGGISIGLDEKTKENIKWLFIATTITFFFLLFIPPITDIIE